MKRRIYTDTSVIGGCLDVEFEDASRQLLAMFKTGEAILVLSDLTLLELLRGYNAVNLRDGYPLLEIRTPQEVIRYEDE